MTTEIAFDNEAKLVLSSTVQTITSIIRIGDNAFTCQSHLNDIIYFSSVTNNQAKVINTI